MFRLAFAQKDTMRRIFQKFDEGRHVWSAAVSCIGILDAIISLASVSSSPDYCMPKFIQRVETPLNPSQSSYSILDIKGGRHPMLENLFLERLFDYKIFFIVIEERENHILQMISF